MAFTKLPAQQRSPLMHRRNDKIGVESEWAQLRECIYGWAGDFVLPRFLQDAELRPSGQVRRLWQAHQGQPVKSVDREFFTRFRAQLEGAVEFLRGRGITVHQPISHTPENRKFPRGENHGSMTPWMRDPFVTIGNNVIELAPRSLFHRRQRFPIRHILFETMQRGARYFAQPDGGGEANLEDRPGFGHLEGGDILVLGKTILVGHSGNASNPQGARWLDHALGPDYHVEMVRIDSRFAHLDCVLLAPRQGLLVISEEAFPEPLPTAIRDWDRIPVPLEIAKDYLGCNNLVLNDHEVVVSDGDPHDEIARQLAVRNFEVYRLPYDAVYRFGGSFRCAYQPLIRRD